MTKKATRKAGRIYERILVFPSYSALCLKELLTNKAVNRKTFVIAIEHNPKFVLKLRRFLKKHFDNFYIFEGEAKNFDIELVLDGKKIDYCFYDMCGNFDIRISNWFHKCQQHFAKNCNIFITYKVTNRRLEGRKSLEKQYGQKSSSILREHLRDVKSNIFINDFSTGAFVKNIKTSLRLMFLAFEKTAIQFKECHCYKDSTTSYMGFVHLKTLGKEEKNHNFDSLIKIYNRMVKVPLTFGYERGQWPGKPPVKLKKIKKAKTAIVVEKVDVWDCICYQDIPAWQKAQITKNAKKAGANPVMVHAGYKAMFARRNNN